MDNLVLDTSALMSCNNIIDKLKHEYKMFIPIVVIEELDNLKTSPNHLKASKARQAIKQIERNTQYVNFILPRDVAKELQQFNHVDNIYNMNDDIIVTSALFNMASLCTCDLNLKIKARALGVPVINYDTSGFYKGYIKYKFTEDEFNTYFEHRHEYFEDYYTNEYIIVEIESTGKTVEYRFDGQDLVNIKLPSSRFIKAKNALQRCALDMLMNPSIEICAVLGTVGGGKTYLCLQMALHALESTGKQSKILGVRSPYGTGKDVGYLKGDFEDKTKLFFQPLEQSLAGGIYEMQRYVDEGKFNTAIPFYMKGCTYNSTVVLCDEAEDLTESEIRLVGTRLGEESRIFFSGDYKQSEIDKTNSNPLLKMCDELKGNPRFACICLDDDVRSEASKLFASMFQ